MDVDNIIDSGISPAKPISMIEVLDDYSFDDFIGLWKNIVPSDLCDQAINFFNEKNNPTNLNSNQLDCIGCLNNMANDGLIYGENHFSNGSLGRSDTQLLLDYSNAALAQTFRSFLKACACHYIKKYPQLSYMRFQNDCIKMQCTKPGEGYHTWHFENSSTQNRYRELSWTIYLNDIPDGEGETEFLYQKKRINPTTGTIAIWPAGMTHVHRGNTIFTTNKYILTGWFIVVP